MTPPFVFTGGVEVSWRCLDALLRAGHPPALAVGYPPSLAHRSGYRSLADLARAAGIPLLETDDLNSAAVRDRFRPLRPVLHVVAGWSQILKSDLLSLPARGTVGFHPTRLPEGRGRAPIPWSILKGLRRSAVSLLYLDAGVDSGDLVAQRDFEIGEADDAGTVYEKVAALHVELLLEHLPALLEGTAPRRPQDASRATYWPERKPEDGLLDWSWTARRVHDTVRALARPYPGAFTRAGGRRLWVWKSRPAGSGGGGPPGRVRAVGPDGVVVACGDADLLLLRLQFEGDAEKDGAAVGREGLLKEGDQLGA